MALPRPILERVRGSLRLALACERAGLLTLADRLDLAREHGDLVAIPLPVGAGQLRAHRIKLRRHGGRDHAVEGIVNGGWFGFERPLPEVLVRAVRQAGGVVVDVGANSGLYALLAAESRNDVVVHAFEPFAPVAAVLRGNVARNRSRARIHVHPQALAERHGEQVLYVPSDSGHLETSASLDPTFKDDVADELTIETTTLDRFWAGAGRPRVTVLKVDTEGSEPGVLAGAREVVAASRPVVFCEVLPRAGTDALDAFCAEHRYVRVRLRPGAAVVAPRVVFDPDAWNHAFVPAERFDAVASAVLAPSLQVVTDAAGDVVSPTLTDGVTEGGAGAAGSDLGRPARFAGQLGD